jgi:TonB family protein
LITVCQEKRNFSGEAGLDPVAKQILAELRKPKPAIYTVNQLDKKPVAVRQEPHPAYPYALQSDGLSGQAEIEVVIDRDGRVLFPRIVSASQEDFGWAAAVAVSRWRFQPPTKDGQKVDARLTIPFTFDYAKMASSW